MSFELGFELENYLESTSLILIRVILRGVESSWGFYVKLAKEFSLNNSVKTFYRA